MSFKVAFALVGLVALVSGGLAAPNCGCCSSCGLPSSTLAALRKYGASAQFSVPSSLPCKEPAKSVNQRPDVNIPLPVPAKIPLGNYCNCQKYSVRPTLIPCAPATSDSAPATSSVTYVSAPASYAPAPVVYAPAAAPAPAINPLENLQNLLNSLPAPAPAPVSAPAPAPACASAPAPAGNPLANLQSLLNSLPAPAPASAPACAAPASAPGGNPLANLQGLLNSLPAPCQCA